MAKAGSTSKEKKQLIITRLFNAPRALVWKAWTEPGYIKRWWGPKGFISPFARIDLRVGGVYLFCMQSPDGQDFWSTGVYRLVIPEEQIVISDSFADDKGNIVPASHYGMSGDWPKELLITVTFEEQKGRTKLTLKHEGIPPGEMLEMTGTGWNESFDKLEKVFEEEKAVHEKTLVVAEPGNQMIVITRIFDASRERVFQVMTDPKLVPQWWGPERYTNVVERMDVRPGGIWRYLQRDAEGNEYAFHGVYHEAKSPERTVRTMEFEGMPGHVLLEIGTLEDMNGKTKFTGKSIFESVEDRDGMFEAGGREGSQVTMDRLAKLVEKQ